MIVVNATSAQAASQTSALVLVAGQDPDQRSTGEHQDIWRKRRILSSNYLTELAVQMACVTQKQTMTILQDTPLNWWDSCMWGRQAVTAFDTRQ